MKKYNVNGVEFFDWKDKPYCTINQCGVEATYPFEKPKTEFPIQVVLMDLDGTTVISEEFWIYLIEKTVKQISSPDFRLSEEDTPFVSGFSTAEHLEYCLNKYKIPKTVNEALEVYHKTARFELNEIMEGRGNVDAFKPRAGLKEFLYSLKKAGIKIGLATSGLDYKAIPEIVSAFRVLDMGDPIEFYDAVITGGRRKGEREYGTIGEMAVKPHPWIYSELVGGLNVDKKNAIVIEDSSAGLLSGRLAGMNVIGFNDGNLIQSGLQEECITMVDTFEDIIKFLQLKK
jgi:beta-phosphoglucomutase-like phosphatase (HAD superfamily)